MKKIFSVLLLVTLLFSSIGYADATPVVADQSSVTAVDATINTAVPKIYTIETATAFMLENNVSLKLAQLVIDAAEVNASSSGKSVDKLKILSDMGIASTNTYYAERGVLDKAADLQLLMAERTMVATEVGLKIALKQSFYGILSAQDTLKIKEQSAERLKQLNDISIQKYKLGLISKNALNATQVDYDAAVSAIETAKRDLASKKLAFNQTMDLPLSTPFEVQGVLGYTVPEVVDLNAKVAQGLENRLDVVAAAQGDEISALTFKVDAMFYGSNTYLYQNSYITAEKAKYSSRQTAVAAEIAIRTAYDDLKNAEEGYLNLVKSLALVKEGYDIAKTMYSVGLNTQTDVSNALIQYNAMEVNVNSALLGYKLAEMAFEASYTIGLK